MSSDPLELPISAPRRKLPPVLPRFRHVAESTPVELPRREVQPEEALAINVQLQLTNSSALPSTPLPMLKFPASPFASESPSDVIPIPFSPTVPSEQPIVGPLTNPGANPTQSPRPPTPTPPSFPLSPRNSTLLIPNDSTRPSSTPLRPPTTLPPLPHEAWEKVCSIESIASTLTVFTVSSASHPPT